MVYKWDEKGENGKYCIYNLFTFIHYLPIVYILLQYTQ